MNSLLQSLLQKCLILVMLALQTYLFSRTHSFFEAALIVRFVLELIFPIDRLKNIIKIASLYRLALLIQLIYSSQADSLSLLLAIALLLLSLALIILPYQQRSVKMDFHLRWPAVAALLLQMCYNPNQQTFYAIIVVLANFNYRGSGSLKFLFETSAAYSLIANSVTTVIKNSQSSQIMIALAALLLGWVSYIREKQLEKQHKMPGRVSALAWLVVMGLSCLVSLQSRNSNGIVLTVITLYYSIYNTKYRQIEGKRPMCLGIALMLRYDWKATLALLILLLYLEHGSDMDDQAAAVVTLERVILSLLFSQSFILALGVVIYVGLSAFNIIHSILIVIATCVLTFDGKKVWPWLLWSVWILILIRKMYRVMEMHWDQGIIGISNNYGSPDNPDSLIFVMGVSCIFQQQVYESQIYGLYGESLQFMLIQHQVLRQYTGLLRELMHTSRSIFASCALWVSYFLAVQIQLSRELSLLNISGGLMVLLMLIVHIASLQKQSGMRLLYFKSKVLAILLTLSALFKYLYQFTSYEDISKLLPRASLYYSELLGLRLMTRSQFLVQALLVVAGLTIRSYFEKHSRGQPLLSRRALNPKGLFAWIKLKFCQNFTDIQYGLVTVFLIFLQVTPALFGYLIQLTIYHWFLFRIQNNSQVAPHDMVVLRADLRRLKFKVLLAYSSLNVLILGLQFQNMQVVGPLISAKWLSITPHLMMVMACAIDHLRVKYLQEIQDQDLEDQDQEQEFLGKDARATEAGKQVLKQIAFMIAVVYVYVQPFSGLSFFQLLVFIGLMILRQLPIMSIAILVFLGIDQFGNQPSVYIFFPLVATHLLLKMYFSIDQIYVTGNKYWLTLGKTLANNSGFIGCGTCLILSGLQESAIDLGVVIGCLLTLAITQLNRRGSQDQKQAEQRLHLKSKVMTMFFKAVVIVNTVLFIVCYLHKNGVFHAVPLDTSLSFISVRVLQIFVGRVVIQVIDSHFYKQQSLRLNQLAFVKGQLLAYLKLNIKHQNQICYLRRCQDDKLRIAKQLRQLTNNFQLQENQNPRRILRMNSSISSIDFQENKESFFTNLLNLLGIQTSLLLSNRLQDLWAQLVARHSFLLSNYQNFSINQNSLAQLAKALQLIKQFYNQIAQGLQSNKQQFWQLVTAARQRFRREMPQLDCQVSREKGKSNSIWWIFANWDIICCICTGIYQIWLSGLAALPLSLILLWYSACLSQRKVTRADLISFWYLSVLMLLKMAKDWLCIPQRDMTLLFGNTMSRSGECLMLICYMVKFKLAKQNGLFYQQEQQQSLAKALIRIRVNQFKSKNVLHSQITFRSFIGRYVSSTDSFRQQFSVLGLKPGRDIYPLLVTFQVVILVYIFFFFNKVLENANRDLKDSFTPTLLLALFLHVLVMMGERAIHSLPLRARGVELPQVLDIVYDRKSLNFQQNQQKSSGGLEPSLVLKYVLNMVLTIGMFYFFMVKCKQKGVQNNRYQHLFFVLWWSYIFINAVQIRFGFNYQKGISVLFQKEPGYITFYFYKILRAIPFLWEVKKFFDWTFIPTSLTLWQFLKLDQLYCLFFQSKCLTHFLKLKPFGNLNAWYTRLAGGAISVFILTLIFGPMVLYSSLNPTLKVNSPISAKFQMLIKTRHGTYTIIQNSHLSAINLASPQHYLQFSQENKALKIEPDSLFKLRMEPYSDRRWALSDPAVFSLKKNLVQEFDPSLQFKLSIMRQHSAFPAVSTFSRKLKTQQLQLLIQIIDGRQKKIQLEKAYPREVRLGDKQSSMWINTNNLERVSLQLSGDRVWILEDSEGNSINFDILSEKYSSVLFNYSVKSFYLTFVILIGNLLRLYTTPLLQAIRVRDNPNTQKLLAVCQAISWSRAKSAHLQQQRLYFYLIDIIRSPKNLLKATGLYSSFRKNN